MLAALGEDGAFVDDGYADEPRSHGRIAGRPDHVRRGDTIDLRRQGHLRPADRRLAVRAGHDLERDVCDAVLRRTRRTSTPSCTMDGRRDGREHRPRSSSARRLPEREGRRRASSSSTTRSRASDAVLNILYVLLALSVLVSLFGIVNTLVLTRVRADARDRDAARDRDDAPAGAAHDPPRERDHVADRRRRSASCSGSCSRRSLIARDRLHRLLLPGDAAHRLRARGDRRRHRRRDLPGPPRREAQPARGLQYE